jgi:hypothetical protein
VCARAQHVLFEKLTIAKLVRKFSDFYEIRNIVTFPPPQNPPLYPFLSDMNSVLILTTFFLVTHFNIILPFTTAFPNYIPFPAQNWKHFTPPPPRYVLLMLTILSCFFIVCLMTFFSNSGYTASNVRVISK